MSLIADKDIVGDRSGNNFETNRQSALPRADFWSRIPFVTSTRTLMAKFDRHFVILLGM